MRHLFRPNKNEPNARTKGGAYFVKIKYTWYNVVDCGFEEIAERRLDFWHKDTK